MVKNSNYNPAPQIRKIATFFLIFFTNTCSNLGHFYKKNIFLANIKKNCINTCSDLGHFYTKKLFATIKIISDNYKKFLRKNFFSTIKEMVE